MFSLPCTFCGIIGNHVGPAMLAWLLLIDPDVDDDAVDGGLNCAVIGPNMEVFMLTMSGTGISPCRTDGRLYFSVGFGAGIPLVTSYLSMYNVLTVDCYHFPAVFLFINFSPSILSSPFRFMVSHVSMVLNL